MTRQTSIQAGSAQKIFNGVVQVALAASDPARTVAFYRDVLGLSVLFETGGMTFFDAGGVRLMIGPAENGGAVKADGAYLYFEPADWTAAEAHVERAGIAFKGAAAVLQRQADRELALRFFEDPDGHALALLGWRSV